MEREKENTQKDLYSQSLEVLGEDFWQEIGGLIPNTGPRIDIYHTPVTVVVIAELPGLEKPEQISIRLEGQTLVLEGEIPRLYPVTDNRISLKERFFGSFRRSLILPKAVSKDDITARYQRGLLVIELRIEPSEQHTQVSVEFA